MKYILSLTLAVITFSITAVAQLPNNVPSFGLVGYWPFDANANDLSGNANHGTVTGATLTSDRFGNSNKAYDFNGISDFITVPDANTLDFTNTFSFSIWLNITDYSLGNESLRGAFGKERAVDNSGFNFLAVSGFHNNRYGFGLQAGTASVAAYSSSPLALNTWEHVVGVYDGSVIRLYHNGVLVGSTTVTLGLTNSTFPLFIGKELTNTTRFYKGKIDDFALWNRALTNTEITSLYEGSGLYFTSQSNNINSVKIYPNPANDFLIIDCTTMNNYGLKIFNSVGKEVYNSTVSQQSTTINLNTLPGKGIYFIHILDNIGSSIEIRKIALK